MRFSRVTLISFTVLLGGLVGTVGGDDRQALYELKPKVEGEQRALQCRVAISVGAEQVEIGSKFALSVQFENTSGVRRPAYNPFFKYLIPFPAKLAIFDANKKYIGDLLAFEGGSARRPDATDWVVVSERGMVGARFELSAGYVARTRYVRNRELPPGTYYLQIIYLDRFLSELPKRNIGASTPTEQRNWRAAEWHRRYPGKEVVRSNVVELRLLAPKGES